MKKKHEHLVKDIPNNEKNRNFVSELNELAKDSNSKYRYRIRYRKPINGYRKGYEDGCVPKKDASCFSVYLIDKTPYKETYEFRMYERHRNEIDDYKSEYGELNRKYKRLLNKHNNMIFNNIINELKVKIDNLEYDKNNMTNLTMHSELLRLANNIQDDLSECELSDEII